MRLRSAANVKIDKQINSNTALADSSSIAVTPIRQAITVIEHKIRNLEKRKRKLEFFRVLLSSGKDLNHDQKTALTKYKEVVQTIKFARGLYEQFLGIASVSEKKEKKQARKEAAAKRRAKLAKVELNQMGHENVREDFLVGRNRAATLTEADLKMALNDGQDEVNVGVDTFYKLDQPLPLSRVFIKEEPTELNYPSSLNLPQSKDEPVAVFKTLKKEEPTSSSFPHQANSLNIRESETTLLCSKNKDPFFELLYTSTVAGIKEEADQAVVPEELHIKIEDEVTENGGHSSKEQEFLCSSKKLFTCKVCDYKCMQRSALKKHKTSHERKKLIACEWCNYKCVKKSKLKKHQMVHFICDQREYKMLSKTIFKNLQNGAFRR